MYYFLKMAVYLFIMLFLKNLFGQDYNRLLNLQYFNKSAGIKELNKTVTQNKIGKDLFASISSGDILNVNYNSQSYKVIFALDDVWDRIIYMKKDTDIIKSFGSFGTGDGQFSNPQDIFVTVDGDIYVADTNNDRIVKLYYDFLSGEINFSSNLDINNYSPRKIFVHKNCFQNDNLIYIATMSNKLILKYEFGQLYKYPEDFSGSAVIDLGSFTLDYYYPYLFIAEREGSEIHMFTMNDRLTFDPNFLFQDHYSYSLGAEYSGVKDFSIHDSYPNLIAYILNDESFLNMRILTSTNTDIIIPGIESKEGSKFNHLSAISVKQDFGDVFIGEYWDDESGAYWYALGPEVQDFTHEEIDFHNDNVFRFTIPEMTTITSEIINSNNEIIKTILNCSTKTGGSVNDYFNEYLDGQYIPYDNYIYRLTAESAYPHEGESDDSNPIAIIEETFEGGVLPSEGDILFNRYYIVQGRTYDVKNFSNSSSYNPEPAYADNWRFISKGGLENGTLTDVSESSSAYFAQYKASNYAPNKVETAPSVIYDEIGVTLAFNGQTSDEATDLVTIHRSNPEACPVIYFNDEPYVNILPESPSTSGMVTDRIVIPPKFLSGDSLSFSLKETGTDVTVFKSIDLFVEDVEKGTKLIRTNSGQSFETNKSISVSFGQKKNSSSSSIDVVAGDTLNILLEQSGPAVLQASGAAVSTPISYCYSGNDNQILSVYQKTSSEPMFMDAVYARVYSYEYNFLLEDTLANSSGQREYYVIFHQDMHLDSINVHYLDNTPTEKTASVFLIPPKRYKVQNNLTKVSKKLPILNPDGEIKLDFKLPPLGDNYERYAYLKVVGRFDPDNVNNLLDSGKLPKTYEVFQNYPNPFNPKTTIAFSLIEPGSVEINVYNLLGQRIKKFENTYSSGGYFSVDWNGLNEHYNSVATGLYIYKVDIYNSKQELEHSSVKKMLFLK